MPRTLHEKKEQTKSNQRKQKTHILPVSKSRLERSKSPLGISLSSVLREHSPHQSIQNALLLMDELRFHIIPVLTAAAVHVGAALAQSLSLLPILKKLSRETMKIQQIVPHGQTFVRSGRRMSRIRVNRH